MQSEGTVLNGSGEHGQCQGLNANRVLTWAAILRKDIEENVNVELWFNQKLFLQGLLDSNDMGVVKWLH